jgi:hypothetical protein
MSKKGVAITARPLLFFIVFKGTSINDVQLLGTV